MKGIERLSDYFGSSAAKEPLRRAYQAVEIQKKITAVWPEPVRVVIRDNAVVLYCVSQAQAAGMTRRLRRLYAIIGDVLGSKPTRKLLIRVEAEQPLND